MQVAVASAIQLASVSPSLTASPFPYWAWMSSARQPRTPALSNESTADEYLYSTSSISVRSCRARIVSLSMAVALICVLLHVLELTSIQSTAGSPDRQAAGGSARRVARVDGEHRTGHVRGRIRARPQARLRDLLRCAEAPQQADDRGELRLRHAHRLERAADH